MDDCVTVYGFLIHDRHVESPSVSRYKATREAIQALGAEILEGTGQDVPPWALDEHGHFRRRATGWGDLASLRES